MWAVKTDGQDDVTDTHVVWKLNTHVGKFSSPILVDGLIYSAAEQSFLTCLEAATGDVVWTERIGGGYQASPVCADGRLYFFNQEGVTTVLKPGRACEVHGHQHPRQRLHGLARDCRQGLLPPHQRLPRPRGRCGA